MSIWRIVLIQINTRSAVNQRPKAGERNPAKLTHLYTKSGELKEEKQGWGNGQAKRLPCKLGDLSSNPQTHTKLDKVAQLPTEGASEVCRPTSLVYAADSKKLERKERSPRSS